MNPHQYPAWEYTALKTVTVILCNLYFYTCTHIVINPLDFFVRLKKRDRCILHIVPVVNNFKHIKFLLTNLFNFALLLSYLIIFLYILLRSVKCMWYCQNHSNKMYSRLDVRLWKTPANKPYLLSMHCPCNVCLLHFAVCEVHCSRYCVLPFRFSHGEDTANKPYLLSMHCSYFVFILHFALCAVHCNRCCVLHFCFSPVEEDTS